MTSFPEASGCAKYCRSANARFISVWGGAKSDGGGCKRRWPNVHFWAILGNVGVFQTKKTVEVLTRVIFLQELVFDLSHLFDILWTPATLCPCLE